MAELPVIGWRLWYSNGLSVDSTQSSWSDAPDNDVQIMEWYHEPAPYKTLTYGNDEYHFPNEPQVKYGKWMDDDAFHALVQKVI